MDVVVWPVLRLGVCAVSSSRLSELALPCWSGRRSDDCQNRVRCSTDLTCNSDMCLCEHAHGEHQPSRRSRAEARPPPTQRREASCGPSAGPCPGPARVCQAGGSSPEHHDEIARPPRGCGRSPRRRAPSTPRPSTSPWVPAGPLRLSPVARRLAGSARPGRQGPTATQSRVPTSPFCQLFPFNQVNIPESAD